MTGELAPGDRIAGFTVDVELGRGGMGVVYVARDASGRAVALKILSSDAARDAGLVKRFRREAECLGKLRHRNVVAIESAGEHEGRPYLVCELVEGGSLQEQLEQGPLPWPDAVRAGIDIASGLAAIHEVALVHRDLKPANVLVAGDGGLKLADFGLVRSLGLSTSGSSRNLTKPGQILGTLAYTAPEQIEAKEEVTEAADLYSLGATLYALVTGRPPFQGGVAAVLKQQLLDPPRPIREKVPDAPAALEDLIQQLLAKKPEDRPPNALTVVMRLGQVGGVLGKRRSRSRRVIPFFLLMLLGALIGRVTRPSLNPPPVASDSSPPPVVAVAAPASIAEIESAVVSLEAAAVAPGCFRDAWLAFAIAAETRIVAARPRDPDCLFRRARAYALRSDFNAALPDLDRSVELDDTAFGTWVLRGNVHQHLRDYVAAQDDYTRAIELHAEDPQVWDWRAETKYIRGDHDGAIADHESGLRLGSRSADGWATHAWALYSRGDDARDVAKAADRGIALSPPNNRARHVRAIAAATLNDFAAVLTHVDVAIPIQDAIDPDGASLLYYLRGRALMALGQRDRGASDFEHVDVIDSPKPSGYVVEARACLAVLRGEPGAVVPALPLPPRKR